MTSRPGMLGASPAKKKPVRPPVRPSISRGQGPDVRASSRDRIAGQLKMALCNARAGAGGMKGDMSDGILALMGGKIKADTVKECI